MSRTPESGTARKSPRRLISVKLTKILSFWLVLALVLLSLFEATTVSAHSELMSAATPRLYFGLIYPQTPDITSLANYETQIGKSVSLVLWYQSWVQNNQQQPFPTAQMEAVREHGAIPVLAWYPQEYPTPIDEPQLSLAKIAGGAWDGFIRQYAMEVKAWGHPLFLRFASEMNGGWVPYSESHSGNSAGQFVQAWRHVHDIFKSVGATNVTWVWCPNVENAYTTPLEDLYPGNAYVDWAGLDGYNWSTDLQSLPWKTFAQIFSQTYNHILRLIPSSMPIMIGETGSVEDGGSKAAWITDALTTQMPAKFTHIKAFIWFDTVDGNLDLRIDTSPQSLQAFKQAIASDNYAANIYSSLDQSPVPIPEDVVLPATPTLTNPSALRHPISESYFSGPAPGIIQILNAQNNAPVPKATVTYQNGVSTLTDSSGDTRIPSKYPSPVLTEVVVGRVVIHTHLALSLQSGYQIYIDLATGKITQVMVHSMADLVRLVIEIALVILVFGFVGITVSRRLSRWSRRNERQTPRGRRGQTARRASREQPSYTSYT